MLQIREGIRKARFQTPTRSLEIPVPKLKFALACKNLRRRHSPRSPLEVDHPAVGKHHDYQGHAILPYRLSLHLTYSRIRLVRQPIEGKVLGEYIFSGAS
jgi:hypothetical protein